jgi:lipopolysaccharide transport system ATP-binding protein
MSSEPAVEVHEVSKRYELYNRPQDRLKQFLSFGRKRYFSEFWALQRLSFSVAQGEAFAILGRNGSGKSTLLQIIAGTLTPTTGTTITHGRLAALLELGAGFNAEFTGRENVYLTASLLGFDRVSISDRFDSIASFADIGVHIDQPVKTYSSGMYVRLAFAVQACLDPEVLIVDEALSVGDEKFQRKCFDYIDNLRQGGCAIVLVTHSTHTVEKFCNRAMLLDKGVLHGVGAANEIVDQYHALLYSDEKTYLRYLNTVTESSEVGVADSAATDGVSQSELADHDTVTSADARMDAYIKDWQVLDGSGAQCEAYRTNDRATIRFKVGIVHHLQEVQGGILIRTVEGVSVFGSSTLYCGKNAMKLEAGQVVEFSFSVQLALCPGTYFVTLATAQAKSRSDMRYLDRKTDAILLRVVGEQDHCAGIAALDTIVDRVVYDR